MASPARWHAARPRSAERSPPRSRGRRL